jgi:hypothetical protein
VTRSASCATTLPRRICRRTFVPTPPQIPSVDSSARAASRHSTRTSQLAQIPSQTWAECPSSPKSSGIVMIQLMPEHAKPVQPTMVALTVVLMIVAVVAVMVIVSSGGGGP